MILSALRTIRDRLRLARDRRRYSFSYSRDFYERGYHDLLHDVGADDLDAFETRGYKDRLYRVMDWVDKTIPGAFTGRHIEVACMYGKTAVWLAQRYPLLRIDAFDFSARFVNKARAHNPFPERVAIEVSDITTIAHGDATFDTATCIDVTEHLPDDVYRRGLREMARVLKPGGFLLLMQGNTPGHVEHIHILPEETLVADVTGAGFAHMGTYAALKPGGADFFHLFQRQI